MKKTLEHLGRAAPSIYDEVKSFFASSIFFIMLGCLFLVATARYIDDAHPSFIFLLAILGVSIVLYGTGTQGVGTADFKKVPVKIAVAGGAGVLATVIGFGVLWQSENIQKVFTTVHKFGLVELTNTTEPLLDLKSLEISVMSDGQELPVITKEKSIKILIPIVLGRKRESICITIVGVDGKSLSPPGACPSIVWKHSKEGPFGETVTDFGTGVLPLRSRPPEFSLQ